MPRLKPTKGRLKFSDPNMPAPISFDVDVYNSPFNKLSQPELVKLRFVSAHFEVHLEPFTRAFRIDFGFGSGRPIELNHFLQLLNLTWLLESARSGTTMLLCVDSYPDLEFGFGDNNGTMNFGLETLDLIKAAKSAITLINEFGVSEHVDMTLGELTENSALIQMVASVVSGEVRPWRVGQIGLEKLPVPGREIAMVSSACVRLGEFGVGLVIVLIGKPVLNDVGWEMDSTQCKLEGRLVTERGKRFEDDDILRHFQNAIDKYSPSFPVHVKIEDEQAKRLLTLPTDRRQS
jgi:hypothetical protein